MINWDEELEKIFADPLFADVTAPQKKITSSDRLIAGFQRITEFVEAHNRLPQRCDDREERALYNQLQGILKDPKKIERCKPYDTMGVLNETNNHIVSEPLSAYGSTPQTEEQQLADIQGKITLEKFKETNNPVNASIIDDVILYKTESGQQKIHCWIEEYKDGLPYLHGLRISRRTTKGTYACQEICLNLEATIKLKKFLDNIFSTNFNDKAKKKINIDSYLTRYFMICVHNFKKFY